jgi:hypothetical protein
MGHLEFDQAVLAYKAGPGPANLKTLLLYAVTLERETPWRNMRAKGALGIPFTQIRAMCDRALSEDEVRRFSGCLGYALKATLAGDELSEPQVCYPAAGGTISFTVMEFGWDSLASTRTNPDYSEAFSKAREYIFEGTPLRTTDREGKGTKDTRLVEGIALCNLSFFLR